MVDGRYWYFYECNKLSILIFLQHFEELVAGHFRTRAHAILSACRGYMEGVPVGGGGGGLIGEGGSKSFKAAVGKMLNGLVSNFTRYGATGCDQYLPLPPL